MKTANKKTIAMLAGTLFLIITLLHSCKPKCERHPDDPECLGEGELITTLKVLVKDSATNADVATFQFKDTDGDGGNTPLVDTIRLEAGKAYKVTLQVWNEAANPAEDITPEIEEEKDEHFFGFQSHLANVTYTYIDFDSNNLPVGLQTYWRTGSASNGHVRITLKHQPGIKDGTVTPGDTDLDVEFPTVIQ